MRTTFMALALACAGLAILPSQSSAQVTYNSISLTWTAVGDDSLTGTASQYDLRYSTSAITAQNFASATRWTSMPAPTASGTTQTVTVTGLQSATTYYFAIKTADEVPNWSGISNILSRATLSAPDQIRPAAITTLAVTNLTETTANLRWTAVGDDSLTGTATSYDIRRSTQPINESNWGSATPLTGEPTPTGAGTVQNMSVTGLTRQTTYYFAMKVSDEGGNLSALSNVASATTPDQTTPAAVRDLAVGFLGFRWIAAPPAIEPTDRVAIARPRERGGR